MWKRCTRTSISIHTWNAEDCWRRVIKYWQLIDENRSVHRTPHGVTAACVSWGFKIQISKFHNTSRTNYRTNFGYVLASGTVGVFFFLFFSFAFLLITEYYNKSGIFYPPPSPGLVTVTVTVSHSTVGALTWRSTSSTRMKKTGLKLKNTYMRLFMDLWGYDPTYLFQRQKQAILPVGDAT